ncbi:hypothetical protein CKR46_16700 [Salmonella enterica]|nr:hypothetical protein [Salmonella enterica]
MKSKQKYRNHRSMWMTKEIEFVKTNYGTMMTSLIAEKLGRTENAIRWVVRNLDIPLTEKYRSWTEVEKKIIRTYSSRVDGVALVASLLPWRTRGAIFRMMDKLGIIRGKKWNAKELRILEQYYPAEGIAVADRLPGRTPYAVRSMATQRGIKLIDSGSVQQKWTPEEWQLLKENSQLPFVDLAALFPERTHTSVRKALDRMRKGQGAVKEHVSQKKKNHKRPENLAQTDNVKISENYNNRCLAWTAQDLAFVKANYGVMKTPELAEKLGRSVASIRITGGRLARGKAGSNIKASEKYRNHRSSWTVQELRFVETHYGVMKTVEIAKTLGRTAVSVRLAAQSLGCCKAASTPWTEAEEDIIRQEYAKGTRMSRIMELLPGRTRNAIVFRAEKMEIINPVIWSEEELRVLKQYYPAMGTHVAEMLPGRTRAAVKSMAYNMKIVFQGDEKSSLRMWSKQEWRLLDQNNHMPLAELVVLFPGRSLTSVRQALVRLKAHRATGAE